MLRSVDPSDIEHPAGLLRLIVLVERDVPQRLQHLTAAIVDAVRLADKGHDHVAARGLVEQHLGVTGGDDLTAAFARHFSEQTVDLALAENLQVRVRLVQQQNGARIRVHVRQQQQRLLQAAAGGRQVEPDAPLAIGHHDLAARSDVPREIELSAEQTPNMHHQSVPWRRVLVVDLQAEIAQHLGGTAFADADVDGTTVQTRLRGGQPRHRRQEGDAGIPGRLGNRHPVGCLAV